MPRQPSKRKKKIVSSHIVSWLRIGNNIILYVYFFSFWTFLMPVVNSNIDVILLKYIGTSVKHRGGCGLYWNFNINLTNWSIILYNNSIILWRLCHSGPIVKIINSYINIALISSYLSNIVYHTTLCLFSFF